MAEQLDESAVRHLARLARLELDDEAIARFSKQLSDIVNYVDQLRAVDTSELTTEETRVPEMYMTGRPDQPIPFGQPANVVNRAAAQRDGMFLVPHVLPTRNAED
jgi:aspartyl-tRNA(Asn)/glutamyl-tRNA(Gln) amidotransferase subunit C